MSEKQVEFDELEKIFDWYHEGYQCAQVLMLYALQAQEIENPVLLIHGEKAHSRYFSEYAFERMTGKHVEGVNAKEGNKELYIIPGASHVDLYDDVAGVIPYDKIESFFRENLK